MKKLLLLLITTVTVVKTVYGQQADMAVGKATYELIHIRDTLNRDKPYKETMALILGRNASVYKSLSKQQQDEMLANQIIQQVKSAPNPNHLNLTITGGGVTTSQEYYQYVNDKKLYTEERIINYYLVEEPLPAIKWKIQKDTTSFGALHCQKATGHFGGRDYEAWFCQDLPFHNGPWKLNGLPGLIVEASDLKKEVIFKFNGFEGISQTNQKIGPPADDLKTTPKDLERLKDAQAKDPKAFMLAHSGGGGTRITGMPMGNVDPNKIQSIVVKKAPDGNTKVNNNPLELPEKK